MTKKRGAPPGNTNALRHGYYTRRFRDVEPQDLEVISGNLTNEIAGMRVAARRIMKYSEEVESQDPMKAVSALNSFGLACVRIAGLSKTLAALTGNNDESQTAISIALTKVSELLNLQGDS